MRSIGLGFGLSIGANVGFTAAEPVGGGGGVATAYTNLYGSGNRELDIVVTSNMPIQGSLDNLVDGSFTLNTAGSAYVANQFAVGKFFAFQFPVPVFIDEITYYQSNTTAMGNFKVQGSNDNVTWTDLSSSFPLGGATVKVIPLDLRDASTSYVHYRILGLDGGLNIDPYMQEFEFKTDIVPV